MSGKRNRNKKDLFFVFLNYYYYFYSPEYILNEWMVEYSVNYQDQFI